MKTKTDIKAHILIGLGYGDEGKGTMTDYLCRLHNVKLVVRYNGGSQAAHNVVTDDGRHHTFAQIGSGSFVPGVKTLLSRFMLLDPMALAHEVADFSPKIGENALNRHFVDRFTPIITPFHVATNCIREWSRGNGKHGSCGKGIGETASDLVYFKDQILRAGMLSDARVAKKLLIQIQERKRAELISSGISLEDVPAYLQGMVRIINGNGEADKVVEAYLALSKEFNIIDESAVSRMIRNESVVFEGAQGMLLDEWHGFHPFTTWSTLTAENALAILADASFAGDREVVGITRAFATRHGAGPFVTEDVAMRKMLQGEHNGRNTWQGNFKVGKLDTVQLRYALDCLRKTGAVDTIALTHMDLVGGPEGKGIQYCNAYQVEGEKVERLEPKFDHDLSYQQRLTDTLFKARALVGGSIKTPEEVVGCIERVSGVKVKYLSFGQKSGDKSYIF